MNDTIHISMDKVYFPVDFDSRAAMLNALDWMQDECVGLGDFALGGRTIFFEKSEDAMMCSLKWAK